MKQVYCCRSFKKKEYKQHQLIYNLILHKGVHKYEIA